MAAVCKLKQESRHGIAALPDITMIRLWGIETRARGLGFAQLRHRLTNWRGSKQVSHHQRDKWEMRGCGDMKLKIRLSFVFTFLLIESGIASNIRGHYVARGMILTWQINRVLCRMTCGGRRRGMLSSRNPGRCERAKVKIFTVYWAESDIDWHIHNSINRNLFSL